jgi:hypothetical protein
MSLIPSAKIKTLDQWLTFFGRYRNVVLAPDGTFLVLDADKMRADSVAARAAPVLTISHQKGKDALIELTQGSRDPEVLDRIAEALDTLGKERDASFAAFATTEQLVLDANDAFARAKTTTQRVTAAMEVAKQTQDLMAAAATYSERKAPLRHIKTLYGVPRNELDYTTNDERAIPALNILKMQRLGRLTVEDTA